MFVLDAFGRRINRLPRLRFVDPPEGGDPNQGPDLGFPKDTALEQMTVEQREAYWKYQARKHEKTAKARDNYDQLKADSEELARVRQESATDQEKALDEARREGENLGAERYLKDAVVGALRALTGIKLPDGDDDDPIVEALSVVDVKKFTNTAGDIDHQKLAKWAGATFGKDGKGGTSSSTTDPVRAALERQRQSTSSSGSIADRRKAVREELTQKKTNA
jgi:hypothetical protein